MRRKIQLIAGVLAILTGTLCAQTTQQVPEDYRRAVNAARRTAMETLEGRRLVVRVYPDPEKEPDRFVHVRVPISNLKIKFSDIKTVYPAVTEAAYVLVQAADQTDPDVAVALDRQVCLYSYTASQTPSILFFSDQGQYTPSWTFLDATGTPIPGAQVEIRLQASPSSSAPSIRLSTGTLDEEGRLPRPLVFRGNVSIRLHHPDYGTATVGLRASVGSDPGIVVVPLVPRNSEAFAHSIQGTIVDSEGNPVPGVAVSLVQSVVDPNDRYSSRFRSQTVSDEQGWFALCPPKLSEDYVLGELPAPGASAQLTVSPPSSLNLRHTRLMTVAGMSTTVVLTPMIGDEFFHTFSFQYCDGSFASPDELEDVTLVLARDELERQTLHYDDFRDGCLLPTGTLTARILHKGMPVSFLRIQLTTESPEHVTFTTHPPIVCQGKVIDSSTGQPIPGAFVLVNYPLSASDPCSLTDEQWQQLSTEASRQAISDVVMYRDFMRVAQTDTDGAFTMTFVPANTAALSVGFSVLAPGRALVRSSFLARLGRDRIFEVQTIEMSTQDTAYFPRFVFEDEFGPVTDVSRLADMWMSVYADQVGHSGPLDSLMQERRFEPGLYSAEVVWGDKYYTFKTVDLTSGRPDVVTFTPDRIRPARITYRGTVLDGATGAPVRRALVVYVDHLSPRSSSNLTPEQWAAIRAMDLHPAPNDPALAPIYSLTPDYMPTHGIAFTLTDDTGAFEIEAEHTPNTVHASLVALVEDYLSSSEILGTRFTPEAPSPFAASFRFEPNENGVATVPPMRIYPAAIVAVCPVIPDPGGIAPPQANIGLRWMAAPGPNPAWLEEAGFSKYLVLQVNMPTTVYVPANATLDMTVQARMTPAVLPVYLGRVRLEQGQILDAGRVEFEAGIPISVQVTDAAETPIVGQGVSCTNSDESLTYSSIRTDEQGRATLIVPAQSTGLVHAETRTPLTGEARKQSIPYQIGGEEEAGKEFVIRLTDVVAGP